MMKELIDELRACANGHPMDVYAPILTSAADALESQAREIERLKRSAQTNWNEFAEDMKAQPSGVVMPPHANTGADIQGILQAIGIDGDVSYHLARQVWNACLDEVARLNQPASAGDERETIRAVFLRNGFTIKEGQTDLKPYVYAAAAELMSIARAALSAKHSEQVRVQEGLAAALFNALEVYKAKADIFEGRDRAIHSRQCEMIRQHAASLLATAPSAGSQGGDV